MIINKILNSQFLWIVFILGALTSCEQEDNLVGYDIVGDNAAKFNKTYVGLSSETIVSDTLRSDRGILFNATIGAYQDPVFGLTKSAYYSQVRLGKTNPDFGNNAIVDSVILSIPVYAITSDTVSYSRRLTQTSYTLNNTDDNCTVNDTILQYRKRTTYKIDSIYGNKNAQMTLRVHRVTQNMGTIDSVYYSNKSFDIGELFGSKTINNEVVREELIQYTNSLKSDSTIISSDSSPMIKINLEGMKSFVQYQIVNQEGSPNLGDQISFISNVLKGIKIDVAENNGFIFNIKPSSMQLKAYISSDNESFVDANNNGVDDTQENCPVKTIKPRETEILNFVIGSSLTNTLSNFYNVSQNEITHSNSSFSAGINNENVNYIAGMGGSKIKLTLDKNQIESIRDNVVNKGWVINEARIKVYPETNIQSGLPLPEYLHLYNASQNDVLADYGSGSYKNGDDVQAFPYSQISIPYNSKDEYYLLRCTEFIKNIIEKNEPVDDLMIEMGNYIGYVGQNLLYKPQSAFYSNRIYNPYRLAVVGTNPITNSDKKLQLEIYYSIKD